MIVTFLNCIDKKSEDTFDQDYDNGRDIVYGLNQLLNELASIDSKNAAHHESTMELNARIVKTIESISTPALLDEVKEHYFRKKPSFLFAISEDENVVVFSWHLPNNQSTNDIKNLALHKIDEKVTPIALHGKPTNYNDIYTLKTAQGNPIYIFEGWEESTEITYRNRIDAYSISDNTAIKAKVFPNRKYSLISEYSFLGHHAHVRSSIEKDGSLILIPQVTGSKIIFSALEFDGTQYTNTYFKESLKPINITNQVGLAQIRYY
ncbi:hypothetical protein [Flagellimonas sp. CMM7]|uniref:hypothetical protein n=1 Tax=Flagellimonas sp. CMM7 TaxID=2654676 RepID=UPI0013D3717F|nr:hypothetical protein [Flagellimonas sp. CMM7]UII79401.1 hypothetical protein LV704_17290 [Flagellimonas sp. CMM7]